MVCDRYRSWGSGWAADVVVAHIADVTCWIATSGVVFNDRLAVG